MTTGIDDEHHTVTREWGSYRVLANYTHPFGMKGKLKILSVAPGKSTSFQRHFHRAEMWYVLSGEGSLVGVDDGWRSLVTGMVVNIDPSEWHQIVNTSRVSLDILELQVGSACEEADIEREQQPEGGNNGSVSSRP